MLCTEGFLLLKSSVTPRTDTSKTPTVAKWLLFRRGGKKVHPVTFQVIFKGLPVQVLSVSFSPDVHEKQFRGLRKHFIWHFRWLMFNKLFIKCNRTCKSSTSPAAYYFSASETLSLLWFSVFVYLQHIKSNFLSHSVLVQHHHGILTLPSWHRNRLLGRSPPSLKANTEQKHIYWQSDVANWKDISPSSLPFSNHLLLLLTGAPFYLGRLNLVIWLLCC